MKRKSGFNNFKEHFFPSDFYLLKYLVELNNLYENSFLVMFVT